MQLGLIVTTIGTVVIAWQVIQSKINIGMNRKERTVNFFTKHKEEFLEVYDIIAEWKKDSASTDFYDVVWSKGYTEFILGTTPTQKTPDKESEKIKVVRRHLFLIGVLAQEVEQRLFDISIIADHKSFVTNYYEYMKSTLQSIRDAGDKNYYMEVDRLYNRLTKN